MLPLELIDNLLRPITLTLRLLRNMSADHLVLDIFTDLTKLVVPVVFLAARSVRLADPGVRLHPPEPVYLALAVAEHEHHEEAHAEHH